jgi:hypothetical protein
MRLDAYKVLVIRYQGCQSRFAIRKNQTVGLAATEAAHSFGLWDKEAHYTLRYVSTDPDAPTNTLPVDPNRALDVLPEYATWEVFTWTGEEPRDDEDERRLDDPMNAM